MRRRGVGLLAVLCPVVVASVTSAQGAESDPPAASGEAPAQLLELIITAQKRPEDLQTVPIAVTDITADALAQAEVIGATDIKRLAPSLQYAENSSVRGTGFQVRGVGTQSFSNGLEQSVGIVVDGVVMARNGMGGGDLLDIDHVEVLRGPQGMLFGKNASAGVVSIVTQRPTDAFSAVASTSFGTYDALRASVIVNVPLTTQTAFRLAAFSNSNDGLVTNVFDGGNLNNHRESGLTAKLLWRSQDDSLQIYVNTDMALRNEACCVSTVRSVVPGSVLADTLAAAGITPGPDNLKVDIDGGVYSHAANEGASVEISKHLDGYSLTSLSAWRNWRLRENVDSDATPLDALDLNFGRSNENQLTEELRLASPTGGRWDYVAGLYYFDSDLHGNNGQEGSLSLTSATPISSRYFIATNTTQSEAAFGQGTFHFTDASRLIAGSRLTHDQVSMDFQRSSFPGTLPSSPPLTLQPSTSATNLSWRTGLEYDLTPGVMAYGTVSRGYKGPGFNALQGATAAALTPVRPEIPTSFELGVKSSLFERRLMLNLALYDTRFKDFQAQFFDPSVPPFGAFVLGSAGLLRTRGVEMDWAVRPSAALTFSGAVGYTDAVYADFKGAACWGTPATQPGCVGGVFDASGVTVPNSPKWTYGLQGRYGRTLDAHLTGFVSADWYWRSQVNDSLGDPNMVRGAYGLLGGSIGIAGEAKRWTLAINVRNLLDQHHTGAIAATLLSAGSYSQYPAEDERRAVAITLTRQVGS